MTAGSEHEGRAGERGVVLHGAGGTWTVRTTAGDTREATLRGRLKQEGKAMKLAVGDDVVVQADARGVQWSITEIVPRRSVLARREPFGFAEPG